MGKWLLALLLILALCSPAIAKPTKDDFERLSIAIYANGEKVNVFSGIDTKALKLVEMVGDHTATKRWAVVFYREDKEGNVFVAQVLFHDEEWIESDKYHVNQTSMTGGLDEVYCTGIREAWVELTLAGQPIDSGSDGEVSKEKAQKLFEDDIEFWLGKLFNSNKGEVTI